MAVDFEDAAASAAATLRRAKMDGDDKPAVRQVCRELHVRLQLVAPHVLRGGHAARYSKIGDAIVRRRGLPPFIDSFVIGHELGHRWRKEAGLAWDDDEEGWCNAFAGALLVPHEPLFNLWRRGNDLGDLLEAYPHISPTCLALRIGEARLAQTIVVQGDGVRYARAEAAPSADLIAVGVEAARRGRAVRAGVARAWRMADGPRRAAVLVDF